MMPSKIKTLPAARKITYAHTVVDYIQQKSDPNRVKLTDGGILIEYPHEVTTQTANLVTAKILWNSIFSTPNANCICADVKSVHLNTPMENFEYM